MTKCIIIYPAPSAFIEPASLSYMIQVDLDLLIHANKTITNSLVFLFYMADVSEGIIRSWHFLVITFTFFYTCILIRFLYNDSCIAHTVAWKSSSMM